MRQNDQENPRDIEMRYRGGAHLGEYGDNAAPDRCLWCGRKLRACRRVGGDRRGDYGDNAFCGLRCGYCFAVHMARLGSRLFRKSAETK